MATTRRQQPSRVLVTGAGAPAAAAVMRGIASEPVDLFAADDDPLSPGLYLVAPDRRLLLPPSDDPGFADAVLHASRTRAIDVVIPVPDDQLLPIAAMADAFARSGVRLMLGDAGDLLVALDRWTALERLGGAVPLPATALIDDSLSLDALGLPVAVTPRRGPDAEALGFVAYEADQLAPMPRNGSWMVAEFAPGAEFSVDVLRIDGREIAAVPREVLRRDGGVPVTSRTRRDPDLQELAGRAAERLGLEGVTTVRITSDDVGGHRVIDARPGFPEGLALTIAAGANMPGLWLRSLLGRGGVSVVDDFREIATVRTPLDQIVPVAELDAPSPGEPEILDSIAA